MQVPDIEAIEPEQPPSRSGQIIRFLVCVFYGRRKSGKNIPLAGFWSVIVTAFSIHIILAVIANQRSDDVIGGQNWSFVLFSMPTQEWVNFLLILGVVPYLGLLPARISLGRHGFDWSAISHKGRRISLFAVTISAVLVLFLIIRAPQTWYYMAASTGTVVTNGQPNLDMYWMYKVENRRVLAHSLMKESAERRKQDHPLALVPEALSLILTLTKEEAETQIKRGLLFSALLAATEKAVDDPRMLWIKHDLEQALNIVGREPPYELYGVYTKQRMQRDLQSTAAILDHEAKRLMESGAFTPEGLARKYGVPVPATPAGLAQLKARHRRELDAFMSKLGNRLKGRQEEN